MQYQNLYELVSAQIPQEVPEPVLRFLINRSIQELAAESYFFRGEATINADGTSLTYPIPQDCIEPLLLVDSDGCEVPYVARSNAGLWEGQVIWHKTGDKQDIVIGQVYQTKLQPVTDTFTLEYARYPAEITGDPAQDIELPHEFTAGIESRVMELFSAANPELLRFHHARWRDILGRAKRYRNQRKNPGSSIQTSLGRLL